MEDLEMLEEKNRNLAANFILIVAVLFLAGGIIFKDGFWAQPLIKYSVLGFGIILLVFGFVYRFQKIKLDDSEYS